MLLKRNEGWDHNLPTMNEYLEKFFGGNVITDKPIFTNKKVNITENESIYNLSFEIPGFSKEDVNIELNDGIITISSHVEKTNENYITKEYTKESFERSFYLPEDVDLENIDASMINGILSITLNKKNIKEDTTKVKKIDIK